MKSKSFLLEEFRNFCKENADPVVVAKYARYFKEGYDAWGVSNERVKAKRVEMKPALKAFSLDELVALGNECWTSGKYEEGNFAIWLTIGRSKEYTPFNFQKIGNWLDQYVTNWAHTDALCSEVFPVYIEKKIVGLNDFDRWRSAASTWKRRAVPVSWIKPMKKGFNLQEILQFLDPMMMNKEKPIQQGLGWFLREAWKLHPAETETFLLRWKDHCGRVIIQYATEKMSAAEKVNYRKGKGEG